MSAEYAAGLRHFADLDSTLTRCGLTRAVVRWTDDPATPVECPPCARTLPLVRPCDADWHYKIPSSGACLQCGAGSLPTAAARGETAVDWMDVYLAGGLEPGPDGAGKSDADDYCRGYVDGLERALTQLRETEFQAYGDGLNDGSAVAESILRRARRRPRALARPGGRR